MDDYMWESILEALPPKRANVAILLYELRNFCRSKYRSPLISKEKDCIELFWIKDGVGRLTVKVEDYDKTFIFTDENYNRKFGDCENDNKLDDTFLHYLTKILE